MDNNTSSISLAVFAALSTIVGYLGTEVARPSIFDRMLWPSRFFNSTKVFSFAAIMLLMPSGGPIHKAAIAALDGLLDSGLWNGHCRGKMLGTAFYNDTQYQYIIHKADGRKIQNPGRNAFWITVLRLVSPQASEPHPPRPLSKNDNEATPITTQQLRAYLPVHLLRLTRSMKCLSPNTSPPEVDRDIGPTTVRHLTGVIMSEAITLAFGFGTFWGWKSVYGIWYLIPLILKLVAFLSSVRRMPVQPDVTPTARQNDTSTDPTTLQGRSTEVGKDNTREPPGQSIQRPAADPFLICQFADSSNGFFLIEGPGDLVIQFFRHYGHPIRSRTGFFGDRTREVVSMIAIIGFILVYPVGMLIFIFAPYGVQWVWLGYQLCTMISMHAYRFLGGDDVASTQDRAARELTKHKQVLLVDQQGSNVLARLESILVSSVAEGREEVRRLVSHFLKLHSENNEN